MTSLYPFVQKTCQYPKGVPIIITENFSDNINEYFGLIQCRIIPPKGLYFPVIPARFNGKLIFTLLSKCAQQKQQTECFHNEKGRAIEGTCVSEEIKLALDFGYLNLKLIKFFQYGIGLKQNNTILKQKQGVSLPTMSIHFCKLN